MTKGEIGRSLVEMLGMLAIMGILTTVGVKAYTYAMNKHRANELIYEAQKRATSVAMQITAGRSMDALFIAEFTNPDGYTFGVKKNIYNSSQFDITLDSVDSDICFQMKNNVGPATTIRFISDDCTTLTFNNDLSKDSCLGVSYLSECQSCISETGKVTNKANGANCIYTYADGTTKSSTCNGGFCLDPDINPTNTTTACLTNNDCGGVNSGYYCNYTSYDADTYCTKDGPTAMGCAGETDPTNCNKAGACTKIGTITKANIAGLGQVISGPITNWWNANNWCEAQGKHLIDIEKFKVYKSGTETLITKDNWGSPAYNTSYGCAKGKICGDWSKDPYNAMWKGSSGENQRILTDAKDENEELYQEKYSSIIVHLAQKLRGIKSSFWTNSSSSSANCGAFYVRIIDAAVFAVARKNTSHFNSLFPLCQ